MASSRVMASASSANPDLARQSPLHSFALVELGGDQAKSLGSMSMEDLIRSCYNENPASAAGPEISRYDGGGGGGGGGVKSGGVGDGGGGGGGEGEVPPSRHESFSSQVKGSAGKPMNNETWEDVTDRKVVGGGEAVYKEDVFPEMTLEDFLARAGEVREEDIAAVPAVQQQQQVDGSILGFAMPPPPPGDRFGQQQQLLQVDGSFAGFGNGNGGEGGGGRGKRRVVQDPLDRVSQQRQRRMIKNRESAARSRERKQAYTVELETMVTRLEEENARLETEQEDHRKERRKQLMEILIPVVEMRRPPRRLRRTCSVQW